MVHLFKKITLVRPIAILGMLVVLLLWAAAVKASPSTFSEPPSESPTEGPTPAPTTIGTYVSTQVPTIINAADVPTETPTKGPTSDLISIDEPTARPTTGIISEEIVETPMPFFIHTPAFEPTGSPTHSPIVHEGDEEEEGEGEDGEEIDVDVSSAGNETELTATPSSAPTSSASSNAPNFVGLVTALAFGGHLLLFCHRP